MLAGHYAPALALKRAAPEVPLWALFLARPRLEPGRRRRYADLLCFALIAVQTLYAFVPPPPPSLLALALSAQLFFVSMLGLAAAVDLARRERRVRRQPNL